MLDGMVFALAVFTAAIAIIVWGKVHRAYVGLASSAVIILAGVLTPQRVLEYLDLDVVGLLIGMAIITYYLEKSGFARWISARFLRLGGRNPMNVMVILACLGSLLSAILDNVSTTLLLAPIALSLAEALGVSAVPYVVGVALGSNLVGAALMIGDPPSMMVASALNLSFTDFIVFNGRPSIFFIIMAACPVAALTLRLTAKKYVKASGGLTNARGGLDEQHVKDRALLAEVLAVFISVVALLSVRSVYGIPLWMPPVLGGLALLALRAPRDRSIEALVNGVDWKTIIFISSVFVLTGGLVETGFVDLMSSTIYGLCGANAALTSALLIWVSVLISAFIDNIPYFAIMIPMVMGLSEASGMNVYTLMWALLIGGSLGGNCTYIGAAANAVAVGILERRNFKVSFTEFAKLGAPYTITAVLIGEVLHYLIFI
ncbi:MAG: SLC13 family permease [Candidatus Nezhaarchaeota archaeon]|nr:SLC13 family permease [Candidatus Nezhaarchaeota archaeon]